MEAKRKLYSWNYSKNTYSFDILRNLTDLTRFALYR